MYEWLKESKGLSDGRAYMMQDSRTLMYKQDTDELVDVTGYEAVRPI